ncbi:MAG: hypothetical protein H3C47_16670, partial [Candidatus Cloacimonetes bacterium]|nr:hypothetical protein [Candidatus Cloacimonadota bacterium]
WYADGAHYVGEEIPANYPQDHAFVPAGKFTNTAITLWDTYRLLEELKQANGLADEEVIRARLIDALKQAVIGKALQKMGEGLGKFYQNVKESKTRVVSPSVPATRQELLETRGLVSRPSKPLPDHVRHTLNNGDENVQVYLGRNRTGEPVYVGISNDVNRRQIEHGDRFRIDPIADEKLTRMQAKAIEEYYIEVGNFHNKKSPLMENRKHSISLKNKDYEHYQDFARDWLQKRGLIDESGILKEIP